MFQMAKARNPSLDNGCLWAYAPRAVTKFTDTEHMPQSPQPVCWAEGLGNCSGDSSKEHIVTEAAFPGPELTVRGLPFLEGSPITIHQSLFKSTILCRKHNNSL